MIYIFIIIKLIITLLKDFITKDTLLQRLVKLKEKPFIITTSYSLLRLEGKL